MFSFWSSSNAKPAPQKGSTRDNTTSPSSPSTPSSSPASTTQSSTVSATSPSAAQYAFERPPASFNPLGICFAGLAFFAVAQVITRRSMVRRYHLTKPTYFHPSNRPPESRVNGAMEAFEALNIATVNVLSTSILVAGGLLWAYDVRSLPELRWRLRLMMGYKEATNESVEEEFEEWLASTLARKNEKDKLKERAGKDGQ